LRFRPKITGSGGGGLHEPDAFAVVHLTQAHAHLLAGQRGHLAPDDVRAEGQLAQPPVDHHQQVDGGRTPQVHERIERGPRRAACVDHVVDEHQVAARHIEGNVCGAHHGLMRPQPHVVAVQGDVEDADGHLQPGGLPDLFLQPTRQIHPARLHADQRQLFLAARVERRPFDNLPGHAFERAVQVGRVHELCLDAILRFHVSDN